MPGNQQPPSLTIAGGGRTFLATTGEAIAVGRDPAASVPLSDERVSRRHALIRFDNGDWIYEDLSSTNGSFVDGSRVTRLLLDRERIVRVGNPVNGEELRLTPAIRPRAVQRHAFPYLPTVLAGLVVVGAAGSVVFANGAASRPSPTTSAAPTVTASATPVPTATTLSTSDVAAIGRASTVQIVQGNVLGSGVYLGNGQVLTAAHVVATTALIVISYDERQVGTARVVRRSKNDDLALLSVTGLDGAGARPVVWGDSSVLRQGDTLVALGYPAGLPLSVKVGVVSGLREDGGTSLVQTDASLNPGMSGGPVLDGSGRLVGITDFGISKYPGLNFAVASTTARAFVDGGR